MCMINTPQCYYSRKSLSGEHNGNSFQGHCFHLFKLFSLVILSVTPDLSKHGCPLFPQPISTHHGWLSFITVPFWCGGLYCFAHTHIHTPRSNQPDARQAPQWNYKFTKNCRCPCCDPLLKLGFAYQLRDASRIKPK